MDAFPIEFFHFLVFTVPGFFIVWSYRKFTKQKTLGDFEYLMFSLLSGLVLVVLYAQVEKNNVIELLQNPYAAAISFSVIGVCLSWIASRLPILWKDIKDIWHFLKQKIQDRKKSTPADPAKYKALAEEVDKEIAEIIQEYVDSRSMLGNDKKVIRTRVLLAFSFLEVACTIYDRYFDLRLGNRQLLMRWIKEYCLDKKNKTYASHPYLPMITEKHMYKFRNAMMHAFSLPEIEKGVPITVVNGLETSSIVVKLDAEFKKAGHTIAFISPDSLLELFMLGFRLMHPEIFKSPIKATQADYEAMERIRGELERRGAKGIPLV